MVTSTMCIPAFLIRKSPNSSRQILSLVLAIVLSYWVCCCTVGTVALLTLSSVLIVLYLHLVFILRCLPGKNKVKVSEDVQGVAVAISWQKVKEVKLGVTSSFSQKNEKEQTLTPSHTPFLKRPTYSINTNTDSANAYGAWTPLTVSQTVCLEWLFRLTSTVFFTSQIMC